MNHCVRLFFVIIALASVAPPVAADHVVLQVEEMEGPWRRQTNISGFMGTGFCTSNANPAVAETAMAGEAAIETGGEHTVWVRAYTSDNSARALQVVVNDAPLAVTHTGADRGWFWEKAGVVNLTPGKVSVVVKDAADGFESVDAVVITDRPDQEVNLFGAEEQRWRVYSEGMPESADALRFNIEAACAPLLNRPDYPDREAWQQAAPAIKQALGAALGLDPMPEKTPLNARVTGTADREHYTIENVVFESLPRFYVTANVYIPKGVTLPAPAIVVVPGHAMDDGKNYDLYQLGELSLVRQGFIVLAYDPIGQGERKQPGFDHPLGYGSLLVGSTNEGMIVWDTLRAVDYLCSRPDVDAAHIGLTGNSGGGENTFYAMPFNERIKAGASFCFVCSYEQWLRHGGNHCICNHLPGIVHEMEEFEIIGLNAPRAFLFGNGAQDKIFPIAGTRETLRRAQALYAFHDAPERVASVEIDAGHGWSQPLREAGVGWMARWLQGQGDGAPIPEPAIETNDPKSPDVLVFDGNGLPEDAETVVTLNRARAGELRAAYATPSADAAAWQTESARLQTALWDVFGGEPAAFEPTGTETEAFEWEGCRVTPVRLTTEPGMEIAAFLLRPANAPERAPAVVYEHETDKSQLRNDPVARELLGQGAMLLAIDPRGLGETFVHENHLTSDSVCLGRHIFAQRMWDLMQAARYLAARADIDPARIAFYGRGPGGLLGVFAAALGAPFHAVAASKPLASLRYFIENDQPQPIWLAVPNLLKAADVAQAVALYAPRPVLIEAPLGYGLQALDGEVAAQEFAWTKQVFALAGAPNALRVTSGEEDAPTAAQWLLEQVK